MNGRYRAQLAIATIVFICGAATAVENTLPRRGFLGARLTLPEKVSTDGVLVQEVIPGTAAEEAGLLADDMNDSMAKRMGGPFNPVLVDSTLEWLNAVTARN